MGSGGVGKSAITVQFVQNIFIERYDPTIEDSYRKMVECQSKTWILEILDSAGTEQFTSMRDLYIKNSDAIILVYSKTSLISFNDLTPIYDQIVRVRIPDWCIDNEMDIPIVLCANKCDLLDDFVVTKEQGEQLANEWNTYCFEVSAKTKCNITEMFIHTIESVINIRNNKEDQTVQNTCKCNIL